MKNTTANKGLASWTIEPFGWTIALLTGIWGAFVGIGSYFGAETVLGLELVATLLFLSHRFKLRYSPPIRQMTPFLICATAALLFFVSLLAATARAQARASKDAKDREQAAQNSIAQTKNLEKLNDALTNAASKNEHVILVSNLVVCTQPSPVNDCLRVDSDQITTFSLIPPGLKDGQKVTYTWAVPIDNMKDLVAFQRVTAEIDPVQRNIVNLIALRSRPPVAGRVRYAVYATVTDPVLFSTK